MGKGFQDAVALFCRPDMAESAAETACVDGHRVVAQRRVGLVVYGDERMAAGLPAFAGHIVSGRDERDDGERTQKKFYSNRILPNGAKQGILLPDGAASAVV